MDLRRQHPNLWLAVANDVFFAVVVGGLLLFGPNELRSARSFEVVGAVIPVRWHGAVCILSGLLMWVGMHHSRDRVMRFGMALFGFVMLYWALGLLVAWSEHKLSGAWGPFIFLYVAVQMAAQFAEPRRNPDTSRN